MHIKEETEGLAPKLPWATREHDRGPWIREGIRFGATVAPPNEQESNKDMPTAEQVLQPRNEPLISFARPLMSGEDRSVDFSPTEPM